MLMEIKAVEIKNNRKLIDAIIDYESGDLKTDEIINLFQELIETGLITQLQGHYQRTAQDLIKSGLITQ